ncbi:MAG: zinc ribbon domain-containing protein [Desulfuromonadaceae bacterium]|nr:zinc ribbon domain-containing protein [Desulfuromonadaceae bacterium]
MPIFEYSCTQCGSRFEKLHKSATEQPVECPSCGSIEVKRELSTFSACAGTSTPASSCSGGG